MIKRKLRKAYGINHSGTVTFGEIIDNNGTMCDIYGGPLRPTGDRIIFSHAGLPNQLVDVYSDDHGTKVLVPVDPKPVESVQATDTSDVTEFERVLEAYEPESEGE